MPAVVRRLVMVVLVVVALGAFAYAFTLGAEDAEVARDGGVERFFPANGSPLELRQTQIGVDLEPGLSGALLIERTEVPADQVNCYAIAECGVPDGSDPQNLVFFVPGPGKVIEELAAGRRCATAVVWRTVGETREDDGRPVGPWCFTVA